MKIKRNDVQVQIIEKQESVVLAINKAAYQLVINPTAREVYEVLDKYETVEALLDYMCSVYKKVDRRVMENDLIEILRLFEIYGLIQLVKEGSESTASDDLCKYIVSGDLSYNKISQFVADSMECSNAIRFGQAEKEYYSPVFLRYRVMQNLEFGVFAEKNDEMLGYITTSANPGNCSKTLVINDVILDGKLTEDEMIKHLGSMINRVFRIVAATRPVSKIRLITYGEKASDKLISIIERIGFEKECTLKDETMIGDMYFYTYFIK